MYTQIDSLIWIRLTVTKRKSMAVFVGESKNPAQKRSNKKKNFFLFNNYHKTEQKQKNKQTKKFKFILYK